MPLPGPGYYFDMPLLPLNQDKAAARLPGAGKWDLWRGGGLGKGATSANFTLIYCHADQPC